MVNLNKRQVYCLKTRPETKKLKGTTTQQFPLNNHLKNMRQYLSSNGVLYHLSPSNIIQPQLYTIDYHKIFSICITFQRL